MDGKFGAIGEIVETLQEEIEQGGATAKQQITGKPFGGTQGKPPAQGQNPSGQQNPAQPTPTVPPAGAPSADVASAPETAATPEVPSQDNKQFVKDLYGQAPEISDAEKKQKEAEDKQKAEVLRQKLHGEYYQELVNPKQQQEERPTEKIEREEEEQKQKEQQVLEEKQKMEELPVVVTKDMGTKEKLRGVSG